MNSYLTIIVQTFRILFDLPRSSSWSKDLLLLVNPYKTLKNVHQVVHKVKIPNHSTKAEQIAEYHKGR